MLGAPTGEEYRHGDTVIQEFQYGKLLKVQEQGVWAYRLELSRYFPVPADVDADCPQRVQVQVDMCTTPGSVCSGHGDCVNGACVCDPGYSGVVCDAAVRAIVPALSHEQRGRRLRRDLCANCSTVCSAGVCCMPSCRARVARRPSPTAAAGPVPRTARRCAPQGSAACRRARARVARRPSPTAAADLCRELLDGVLRRGLLHAVVPEHVSHVGHLRRLRRDLCRELLDGVLRRGLLHAVVPEHVSHVGHLRRLRRDLCRELLDGVLRRGLLHRQLHQQVRRRLRRLRGGV